MAADGYIDLQLDTQKTDHLPLLDVLTVRYLQSGAISHLLFRY